MTESETEPQASDLLVEINEIAALQEDILSYKKARIASETDNQFYWESRIKTRLNSWIEQDRDLARNFLFEYLVNE